MQALPERITALAFTAGNGEYAWPRPHILEALRAISETKQAVLGGEVWCVREGKISGLLPSTKDEPPGVYHWDTSKRRWAESWPKYCQRTMQESIETVSAMQVEEEVLPEFREHLFFNVTYVDRNEA